MRLRVYPQSATWLSEFAPVLEPDKTIKSIALYLKDATAAKNIVFQLSLHGSHPQIRMTWTFAPDEGQTDTTSLKLEVAGA